MRERKANVHGPFPRKLADGTIRYRLVFVGADGSRRTETYDSRAKAIAARDEDRDATGTRTIEDAVDAFAAYKRECKLAPGSVTRTEYHLRKLLKLESNGRKAITVLTPKLATELYDDLRTRAAVDSHRNGLAEGKAFGRWCARKGWLKADPFAGIKGVGRRKRGKPQPRVTEARALFNACLARADRDPAAVAVATILVLGGRASEVVTRDVRDVDDSGRLLWISCSKTPGGKRTLAVPALLRPHLRRLTRGKQPHDPLFTKRSGERADRHWAHHHTERLAKLARVRVHVTPQALRGLHGTLARVDGVSADAVARQLGHADTSLQSNGTYLDREWLANADRAQLIELLAGNFSPISGFPQGPGDGAEVPK